MNDGRSRASSPPVYDRIGQGYAARRVPDPRWQASLHRALGDAATVVNVGAGTGSYEPVDRRTVAVEPSIEVLRQRGRDAAPADWARPAAYLDPAVRRSMSGLSLLPPEVVARAMARLADDLASGAWDERRGDLAGLDEFDAGYRIVVGERQAGPPA